MSVSKVNDGLHKGVYEGEGVLTCKSQTVHHEVIKYLAGIQSSGRSENTVQQLLQLFASCFGD